MDRIARALSLLLMLVMLSPSVYANEVAGCKLYYVVKPADTLGKITFSLGMTPAQRSAIKIAETNDIENKNVIKKGSKLCVDENVIKTGSTTLECHKINNKKKICMDKDSFDSAINSQDVVNRSKKCSKFHEVKAGESLSIIARSLGMSPPYESALQLADASGIKNPNRVEIGDKVCINDRYLNGDKKEKGFKCFKTKNNRELCIDAVALAAIRAGKPKEAEPEPKPEIFVERPKPQKAEEPSTPPSATVPVVVEKKPETPKEEPKKVEPAPEPEVLIGIAAMPFLSYSRIDAVDVSNGTKGSVLSRADYGADFKIMQLWGNYFTSEMFLQAERRTYISNSGRTFNQRGGDMLNFGVGMGFKFWNRLELKGRAFYGDEFYFRAPNTTSLAIDRTKTFKADIALYFDIATAKHASTGLGGGGRIIKAASVDPVGGTGYGTKTGYGYFGTFYMRHRFERIMFEESFTYENITKNTDLFKQIHSAAYIKGGIIVLF